MVRRNFWTSWLVMAEVVKVLVAPLFGKQVRPDSSIGSGLRAAKVVGTAGEP